MSDRRFTNKPDLNPEAVRSLPDGHVALTAKIVRRGRGLHLVPADYPKRICVVCRGEVLSRHRHVRTCSKSCGMSFAWRTKRDRKRQSEVMRAVRAGQGEELLAASLRGHRTPEYRSKISERTRRGWADPVQRTRRVVAMEAALQGPQAEERVAKHRERQLRMWSDPEWKARAIEGMRTGKRGRYKRAVMDLLATESRIPDQAIADRVGLTLEQVKVMLRRLFRMGLTRAPEDGRKSPRRTRWSDRSVT